MSTTPPTNSTQQDLQTIIDRVAEESLGEPIERVRERVVESLRDNGFVPPSRSWVDAVAREAVHGNAYALNLETLVGHELTSAYARQLEDAPAQFAVPPPQPSVNQEMSGPPNGTRPTPPKKQSKRAAARLLCAVAGAFLILAWQRRHKARPRSGTADG